MFLKNSPYRYISLISLIGFFISGIIAFPFYAVWWDSNYAFNYFSIEQHAPTNWMGWFYVYFWDILYRLTGQINSIGFFQSITYWICMPIIYCNLFKSSFNKSAIKFRSSYHYWYLALTLNPIIFGFFFGITNNVFVASFLLIALALFSLYLNSKNKIALSLAFVILTITIFIRRDALILVLPLIIFSSYFLCNQKWLLAIILTMCALFIQRSIDHKIIKNFPDYDKQQVQLSINTEGIIISYDLVAMSFFAKKILVPDPVLKPEFQGKSKQKLTDFLINQSPYDVVYEWSFHQNLGRIYQSNSTWHSGLKLKDVFPIYLQNIHWYLYVKILIFYGYSLYLWPFLFVSILALIILWNKNLVQLFTYEERSFFTTTIVAAWIFSGAVMLSVNSIQARYIVPSNILLWLSSLFTFYVFFKNYSLKFLPK